MAYSPTFKSRTVNTPLYTEAFCLERSSYFAHALSDGAIIVQEVVADGGDVPPHTNPSLSALAPGQLVPVLLIDAPRDLGSWEGGSTGREPYQLLAWSNEETCLLAAASQHCLQLFSLSRFFTHEASTYSRACASLASTARSHAAAHSGHHTLHRSTSVHATSQAENEAPTSAHAADHGPPSQDQAPLNSMCTMPPPSASGWDLVATLPLQHPLLAVSWTLQGGGLLLSDADRNVTMLSVRVEPGMGGKPMATVSKAWSAQSDAPQPLIAAGLGVGAPSATAHTRKPDVPGGTAAHRVLVWWPQHNTTPPSPSQQPQQHGVGNATGCSTDLGYSIGAEIIRHPVQVTSMQWSPILPGGSNSSSNSSSHAHSRGTQIDPHRSAAKVGSNEQLALMTVGTDRMIRVWVEVKMQDLLPAHLMSPARGHGTPASAADAAAAAAAAAALSLSQFCLALVIEPPLPSTPLLHPSSLHSAPPEHSMPMQGAVPHPNADQPTSLVAVQASWCRPCLTQPATDPASSANGLHGPSIPPSTPAASPATAPDSLQRHVARRPSASGAAKGSPPPANAAAIAARVHWVVAAVTTYHSSNTAEGSHAEECVCVWAVDGLASSAVAGMTRGAAVQGPRAVLWGCHRGMRRAGLAPHGAVQHQGMGAGMRPDQLRGARCLIDACVTYPAFVPVVHVAMSLTALPAGYAEACAFTAETVTQDTSVASPTTSICVHSRMCQPMLSSHEPLHALLPHPSMPELAASLSESRALGMWCLDPVVCLPLVPPSGSGPPQMHDALSTGQHDPSGDGPITAMAWLPGLCHTPEQEVEEAGQQGLRPQQHAVWTSFLACASQGVIAVHALQLPYLAVGSWQPTPRHVQVLGTVLRISLPRNACLVRHLFSAVLPRSGHDQHPTRTLSNPPTASSSAFRQSLTALPGSGTSKVQLLALLSPSPNCPATMSWGAWLLEPALPLTQPTADQDSLGLGAEGWASPCHGHSLPSLCLLAHSIQKQEGGGAVLAASAGCHLPSPAQANQKQQHNHQQQQLVLTSSTNGSITLWRMSSTGLAPPTAVAQITPKHSTADTTAKGISTRPVEDNEHPNLATPSCMALHELAQLCAAATPPQPQEGKPAQLHIWRAHAALSPVQPAAQSEVEAAAGANGGNRAAPAVASCGEEGVGGLLQLHDQWDLEAVLPVEGTPVAVAWLPPSSMPVPCLALGCASGRVSLYACHRESGWILTASHQLGSGLSGCQSLAALGDGSLALAAGHDLAVLTNTLEPRDRSHLAHEPLMSAKTLQRSPLSPRDSSSAPGQRKRKHHQQSLPLGSLAWRCNGPLPLHSPELLQMLVTKGRLTEACRMLRVLLHWLQASAEAQRTSSSSVSEPPRSGAANPAAQPTAMCEGLTLQHLQAALCQVLLPGPPLYPLLKGHGLQLTRGLRQSRTNPPPGVADTSCSDLMAGAPTMAASSCTQPSSVHQDGADNTGAHSTAPKSGTEQGRAASSGPPSKAQSTKPAPPPPAPPIATGQLDMSAFAAFPGFGGFGPPQAPVPPHPAPPPPQPSSSGTTGPSSLDTGMLDKSAFAAFPGFGGFSAPPQAPPQPTPPPPQPSSTAGPSSLDTGTLDMSAFAAFTGFSSLAAPPPPQAPSPINLPPHAQQPVPAASPPPPPPPAAEAEECMPLGLRKQMRKQAEEAAEAASKAASAARGEGHTAEQAALVPGLGASNLQQQPQQPQQLPDGCLLLPALGTSQHDEPLGPELLSNDELASLEQLLGVQHQEKGTDYTSKQAASYLPSYLRDDDEGAEEAARVARVAEHLLQALHLSKEEARQLAFVGRALTRQEPQQQGLASTPSTGDVMDALDAPARTFLAVARLASAEERHQQDINRSTQQAGSPDQHPPQQHLRRLGTLPPFLASSSSLSSLQSQQSLRSPAATDASVKKGECPATWRASVGLLPGLSMVGIMHAAASSCQAALLDAALPHVAWAAAADAEQESSKHTAASFMTNTRSSGPVPVNSWPAYRLLGAGFWLTDPQTIREKAGVLARAQFLRRKDPYDCTLLYLALGKKSLLSGLFKQTSNTRVVDFLSRNFEDEGSRRAAAKNAFALLGQHKYETAAGFFLLAGCLYDGVSVLAKECSDPQLALFVARLVEGTTKQGGAAWQLLQKEILPAAQSSPDPATIPLLLLGLGEVVPALQHLTTTLPGLSGSRASSAGVLHAQHRPTDPAALDFVLGSAAQLLSGRAVPHDLAAAVATIALDTAHSLEARGLPSLALESLLLVATFLAASGAPKSDERSTLRERGSQQHEDEVHTTNLLQPMYARLVAQIALLPGKPMGMTSPSLLSSAHLPPQQHPQHSQQQQQQQLVQELVSTLTKAQQHDLGLEPAAQLEADPQSVLGALSAVQRSMAPSQSRAILPPLPPFPLHLLHHIPSSSFRRSSISSSSSIPLHNRRNFGELSVHTRASDGGAGEGASVQGSPHSPPTSNHSGAGLGGSILGSSAPQHSVAQSAIAASMPASPGTRTVFMELGARRSWSGPRTCRSAGADSRGVGWEAAVAGSLGSMGRVGWFAAPELVLAADSIKCTALACCSAKAAAQLGRGMCPIVAASKSGLIHGELPLEGDPELGFLWPQDYGNSPTSSSWSGAGLPGSSTMSALGRQGSSLLGLIGQVLENVRWTPDPWAAMTSSEEPVMTAHRNFPSFASEAKRGGSLCVSASATQTTALAAHPEQDLFLSGSSSDHVFLWHFGATRSSAAYVPLLQTNAASAAHSTRRSMDLLRVDEEEEDPVEASMAVANATPSRKQLLLEILQIPHWNSVVRLLYTRQGSRFLGLGNGGLVATWRQDLPPGSDGLGYADWVHHCVPKRGHDLVVLNDRGSQFIVCGKGERGGVLSWWDTLSSGHSARVAELCTYNRHTVPTAMQLCPNTGAGTLLVYGDDAGSLTAVDLRMLGNRTKDPVWTTHGVHTPGHASMCIDSWAGALDAAGSPPRVLLPCSAPSTPGGQASDDVQGQVKLSDCIVSGGKDGSLKVVDAASGHIIQSQDLVHWAPKRNVLSIFGGGTGGTSTARGTGPPPQNSMGVPVTSVVCMAGGLLTTGADGAVLHHKLLL